MNKRKVESKSGKRRGKILENTLVTVVLKGQKIGTWAQRWTMNDWDPGLKDRKPRLPQQ